MRPATLRFFCEVDEAGLAPLFTREVVETLRVLGAGVTLALPDLSAARANVVRALGDAGVPVGGWVLLPREQGYFATPDNAALVESRCDEVVKWLHREGLRVEALGLDLEPDLRELDGLMTRPMRTVARWALRRRVVEAGRYDGLVARLRARGVRVESYVWPLVLEDRRRGRSRWQRLARFVDVPGVDREVVMLYSSLAGAAVLDSYAGSGLVRAIGVGSTGGGVDPLPKLGFEALARDLRVAAAACDDVSVFSLEGCVQQGLLARLVDFDWDAPAPRAAGTSLVDLARRWLG